MAATPSKSFSPELNQEARKPQFNADPRTLFTDGAVPAGWQTMEAADAVAPDASDAATGVTIVDAGLMLTNGTAKGEATTALTGSGEDATVDLLIAQGQVQAASIASGGSGYANGDTLSVDSFAGVVLAVTVQSD